MTRGGTRSIAVLAVAALVALLLVACGSDSGSSDSNSTGTATSAQDNGSGGGTEGENDAGESQSEPSPSSLSAEEVETPLKVSGGGSEQFLVKGGDNSIQEFGEEAGKSELEEAAEVVHSFFVARASGDWATACSYLSKEMRKQLEQLAESSTSLANKDCASFLEAFTTHLSAREWQEITTIDAGSLRSDGAQSFLIYFGSGKTAYAMPLKQEDGGFKVGALAGNALG